MRKGLIIGACFLFILIVLMSVVSAGWFSDFFGKITGKAIDDPPRVSFWSGKVNQHTENGVWITDSDGSSGASWGDTEAKRIQYCDNVYEVPEGTTTASPAYEMETIDFCTAGNNVCTYTSTRQTYKCVSGEAGGDAGSSTCVPKTCQSLGGYNCGRWNDGCGATLNCGICASNENCINGVCTAGASGWTEWLNRDGPDGSGDYETKSGFTGVCDTPTNIECRVRTTEVSYDETGQVVTATPSAGCYCLNSNNPEGCLDYEVRFLCPDMVSSYCGDGTCDADETCSGCLQDCGACGTSATCEDSDVTLGYSDGKNYYVRGWYGGDSDFCSLNPGEENILLEYYCSYDASGNPIKNYTKHNCSTEGKVCKEYTCVGEKTPRVAFWPGKINQHFTVTKGIWMTDSDKISSADIDKLAYCKKWYGSDIVFVKEYKLETITTWMAAGNKGGPYTSTKQSYECVNSSSFVVKENGEKCSLDFECKSGSCGDILANQGDTRDITTNPESVCHENSSKCVIDSTGIEVNYGVKSCLTSKVFRTCYAYPNKIGNSWGGQTPCASDDSCFEGRGCLKHEFIFRLNDNHFPADKYPENVEHPPELEDAMELSDSCVGVSFRINKMPPEESDLDDFVSEMEARGYYYYITAGSSDFRTFAGYTTTGEESPFMLDIPKLCGYLKNEHAEGLYLHEMGRLVVGEHSDKAYDWENIEQVLACAKANKKKVIWSDFGSGGWTDIRYYIDHDDEARRIFETYGDVLVPLIADNTRTDEGWRKDLPGGLSFEDIKYVSDKYTDGERGGSIQDWHWEAITGSLDVPASDIERYIGISYDEGGKYSQFEDSNWDKNEPQNNGEFYIGIERGKNYICGVSPCVSSDCDIGSTCESPKCIGSYDEKVKRYDGDSDWIANTYYGPSCEKCTHTGRTAYTVDDLAWYKHTCVEKRFLFCWGARWSPDKTYVANAYKSVSCEGLPEPACNSYSGCSWGSFSCAKP